MYKPQRHMGGRSKRNFSRRRGGNSKSKYWGPSMPIPTTTTTTSKSKSKSRYRKTRKMRRK